MIGEPGSCIVGGDAEECGMWWKYRVWCGMWWRYPSTGEINK
jgi:hypothetical protein